MHALCYAFDDRDPLLSPEYFLLLKMVGFSLQFHGASWCQLRMRHKPFEPATATIYFYIFLLRIIRRRVIYSVRNVYKCCWRRN